MKTNQTKTLSSRSSEINCSNTDINIMNIANASQFTKKEKTALKVIYGHAGKRFVYEAYSATAPEMAQKYLQFISKNPWELYIKWDKEKQRFVA